MPAGLPAQRVTHHPDWDALFRIRVSSFGAGTLVLAFAARESRAKQAWDNGACMGRIRILSDTVAN
ncbi:MAG: hypothetical protein ABI995_12950, partial [Acidobacteriota bacterium]